jgi:hypothetical protein
MIKKAVPFLIFTVLFFMTSCGTSAPKTGYVSDMAPVVEQLSRWQTHYQNFESLLMESSDNQGGMSRLEMIDLYNMATGYKISREDYVNMGFLPLDALVGDGNKFARESHALIDSLSAITPDEKIQDTHQAILKCVQTRVAFAEEISSSIRDLEPIDLSGDASPCATFDADMEKLTTYVNANK